MKIGVIADDFTRASDIALTLAEAGMTVAQFIGVPSSAADPALQAGVVALKSRTAPAAVAVADSLAAFEWLIAQGATQIVFKVCSTFDSTPKGNIGPVLDALAERLNARPVIICPAFPENGRSVYMGQLFVGDVPINESGMRDHPLTPMTDSDLRRVLAAQSTHSVAHVPAPIVFRGAEAIVAALPKSGHVIVDAIRDSDMLAIGAASKTLRLICGGSGIAMGLPANFGIAPATPHWSPVRGKGVVLAGSCSQATREQVARFRTEAASYEVSAEAAIEGSVTAQGLADWVLAQDAAPLIYSSADPIVVRAAQNRFGMHASAKAIEDLFADLATLLSEQGVRRFVVAGGETSGAVVSGLAVKALRIGPRIAPGVPLVRVEHRDLALALKSGNFGGPDFFHQALALMEGA